MMNFVNLFFTNPHYNFPEKKTRTFLDDNLYHVFSFLKFHDLESCALVCKKWKNIFLLKIQAESLFELWYLSKNLRFINKAIKRECNLIITASCVNFAFFCIFAKNLYDQLKKSPYKIFYFPVLFSCIFLLIEDIENSKEANKLEHDLSIRDDLKVTIKSILRAR